MEQRRLTGWIALIVLILGVAVFVYNDYRRNRDAAAGANRDVGRLPDGRVD